MAHVNVIVSGLPHIPKLTKLVMAFKPVLSKRGIDKFWIKTVSKMPNSDLHSAEVEFYSMKDANAAVESLNEYKYYSGKPYTLTARVGRERRPSPRRSPWAREPYEPRRAREPRRPDCWEREPSPTTFDLETQQLDLEIELLKKKRMIIEEERRLLMESKKLQLVQTLGPRGARHWDGLEGERDRRRRPRRSPDPPPRRRARSRSPLRPRSPFRRRPPPEPRHRHTEKGQPAIPQFFGTCRLILKQMSVAISKHSDSKEREDLRNLLRVTLRNRLVAILDQQPIMKLPEVVALYRVHYPDSTDEELVLQHVETLRAAHLPPPPTWTQPDANGDHQPDHKTKGDDGKSSQIKEDNVKAEDKADVKETNESETDTKIEVNSDNNQKAVTISETNADESVKVEMKSEPNSETQGSQTKSATDTKKEKTSVTKPEINDTVTKKETKTDTAPETNAAKDKATVTVTKRVPETSKLTERKLEAEIDCEEQMECAEEMDDWLTGGDDWIELNTEESPDAENDVMEQQ